MADNDIELLLKGLKKLYEQLDAHAVASAEKMNASCKRGCIGCCYQMTSITIPEALLIADVLLKKDDWHEWAKKMHDSSLPYMQKLVDRDSYFKQALPCPLLDVEKRECREYASRPSPCRYYYVVTPPEHCYPESEETTVGAIDLAELDARVWKYAMDMLDPEHAQLVGPIPLMTLFGMDLMTVGMPRHEKIREQEQGLMSPAEWVQKQLMGGGIGGLGEDTEQTRAIRKAALKVLG